MKPVLENVWCGPRGRVFFKLNNITTEVASDGRGGLLFPTDAAKVAFSNLRDNVREEIIELVNTSREK